MDATSLAQLPILIVDCQTTGATPEKGELLDLAWMVTSAELADAVEPAGGLLELKDELPPRIARLTGVTPDDLQDAAPRDQRRESFLAALQAHDGPVVAHYARFEQRFLDDFLGDEWGGAILCTHAIARRLLPDLPRLGIRALSGYFGTSMDEEKRAAGHAAATARIWSELVSMLEDEGVTTLDELRHWLDNTAKPSRASNIRRFPLARERRLGLPEVPGVYRMLGRDGVVLYVGKATSLKARVNSYYRGKKGEGERKLELVTQVWELDVTPTPTPLHAAVLEQREIKTHEPPYNRQFRSLGRSLAWNDPSDLGSTSPTPTARHTLGPLPSARSLEGAFWLAQSLRGDVTPPPFIDVALEAVQQGLDLFLSELEGLGLGPEVVEDAYALAELGAHYRALEAAEAEMESDDEAALDELDEDEPERPDEWTAEDIAGYARWVARGVERSVRRARTLSLLRHADLEWSSPVTGEMCRIEWRAGRVCEGEAPPLVALVNDPFDLESYDETAVLVGELKRLIRYEAQLSLRTHETTFDRAQLSEFFSR